MTPKQLIKSILTDPMQILDAENKTCNLCGNTGRFWSFGFPARRYSRCPKCSSLERHRLYGFMMKDKPDLVKNKTALHFAPEQQITALVKAEQPSKYVTADIEAGVAERQEDMTALTIDDAEYDVVIANHVLEHIPDDAKAFSEVYRVLKPGGVFCVCVPIIEAWEQSYENENVQSEKDRRVHFGQRDHVRYYGRDFLSRFEQAGFKVTRYQVKPEQCIDYALNFGETIFIGKKPA